MRTIWNILFIAILLVSVFISHTNATNGNPGGSSPKKDPITVNVNDPTQGSKTITAQPTDYISDLATKVAKIFNNPCGQRGIRVMRHYSVLDDSLTLETYEITNNEQLQFKCDESPKSPK